MKRKYQGIIVFNVKGKEESLDDMLRAVEKEIISHGGTLEKIEKLGKKDFAYNARHLESGEYVSYSFESEAESVNRLRDRIKLNGDVHLQHYQLVS